MQSNQGLDGLLSKSLDTTECMNGELQCSSQAAPSAHIFVFWRRKNKFLRHPGAENLLQYWLQMHCDRVRLLAVHYK